MQGRGFLLSGEAVGPGELHRLQGQGCEASEHWNGGRGSSRPPPDGSTSSCDPRAGAGSFTAAQSKQKQVCITQDLSEKAMVMQVTEFPSSGFLRPLEWGTSSASFSTHRSPAAQGEGRGRQRGTNAQAGCPFSMLCDKPPHTEWRERPLMYHLGCCGSEVRHSMAGSSAQNLPGLKSSVAGAGFLLRLVPVIGQESVPCGRRTEVPVVWLGPGATRRSLLRGAQR